MILYYRPDNGFSKWGTGGSKRSYQVYELLYANFKVIERKKIKTNFGNRFNRIYNGLRAYCKLQNKYFGIKDILYLGYLSTSLQNLLKENPDIKCVVWEGILSDNYHIPFVLKLFNIPVLNFPHNIESMVADQEWISEVKGINRFAQEIKQFEVCDTVFTISREEQWLLKLNGINAKYFPYYPSPDVYNDLAEIRNKRKQSEKSYFLIMGSFFYPPIRNGILEIIHFFISEKLPYRLKIGGYNSEEIHHYINNIPANIEVMGTLDKEQLNDSLTHCKAVIVNQQTSTGALTKIIEFQIAGIPVIANSMSLRSYFNIKGLHPFETYKELPKYLDSNLDEPDTPQRNMDLETAIINCIKQFTN